MKIKCCPICKSEIKLNAAVLEPYLYCGSHFLINERKIRYYNFNTHIDIYLIDANNCEIISTINKEYKTYLTTNEFLYKAIRILENNEGILKLRMLVKEVDNLLIFQ